ncbi:MAG: type II toxin-antitoxin system VapC family toxin [Steroidobacteraceae bacterium]
MILLDTNVISELMREAPAAPLTEWIGARDSSVFATTSLTQAEILHGVLMLPAGRRRDAIARAAQAMFSEDLAGRIMPFDSLAAQAYAEIVTDRSRRGRPISQFDAQIAAIARATGAVLATRNARDFEHCGIGVVNPWTAR